MAAKITLTYFVWILSIFCVVHCWDLVPLKPVSCPEGSKEDGICYEMVHHQVRCVNITFGYCIGDGNLDSGFHVSNGRCLRISNGYCTKYSCQRTCCADFYTEDFGECESPYCDKHCENGGTCIWSLEGDQKEQKCACSGPFFGDTCQHVKCDGDCENGGTCVVDGSGTICSCSEGFYGKTCSYRLKDLSLSCPKPNRTDCCGPHRHCRDECRHDDQCKDGEKCCHDSCCRKCIRPVSCYHNGKQYRPGDVITDECTECRCLVTGKMDCSWFTCPVITCRNETEPISKDGACCPSCPGDGTRTQFENCRDGEVKELAVRQYTKIGFLDDLQIRATDGEGNDVLVTYSKDHIDHCECTLAYRPRYYVMAIAGDRYKEDVSTCGFWVIITDSYAPEYNSCPADIFAQKGEVIEWNPPRANDNVGILYQLCDIGNSREFSTGNHTVTCTAVDYDENKAYCQFTIYVYDSEEAGESTMPPGLKSRQKKGMNTAYIIAVTFSAVFIIIITVFIGCMVYRQRKAQAIRRQNGERRRVPTVSGHVFVAENGKPAEFVLPPYTPKYEPPSYEDIHSDLRPPTYKAAIETRSPNRRLGPGFLNGAYHTSGNAIRRQDTSTHESSGENVYEEIRLN